MSAANVILKTEMIPTENGGNIPIRLVVEKGTPETDDLDCYFVDVDGVEWFVTERYTHAVTLFTMMTEHLTEYMHYRSVT